MISLKILDVPKFMSLLLSSEVFDDYFATEAVIAGPVTYSVDGKLNRDFFDEAPDDKYARWSMLRPVCRELVKGKQTPLSMRFTLEAPGSLKDTIKEGSENSFKSLHLLLNIRFVSGALTLVTAVSFDTFTLDKEPEAVWDKAVIALIEKAGLNFNIE